MNGRGDEDNGSVTSTAKGSSSRQLGWVGEMWSNRHQGASAS